MPGSSKAGEKAFLESFAKESSWKEPQEVWAINRLSDCLERKATKRSSINQREKFFRVGTQKLPFVEQPEQKREHLANSGFVGSEIFWEVPPSNFNTLAQGGGSYC